MSIRLNENREWHEYYDYISMYDEYNVLRMIINGKNLWTPLIKPAMYQQALDEFTKFGRIDKFPSKYIYQWMGIIMKNTAIIRAITSIAGHDIGFPTDAIIDACFNSEEEFEEYKMGLKHKGEFSPDFGWMGQEEDDFNEDDEVSDEEAAKQYLEDNDLYGSMRLPDGSRAWSDFGVLPLENIIIQYDKDLPPEEVLVLINKALDVTHQYGDLASAFIEGGRRTLSQISDKKFINEEKKMKEYTMPKELSQYKEYTRHIKPLFDLMKEEEGIPDAPYPKVVLHTKEQFDKEPIMIKTGYFDPTTNKVHAYLCDNEGPRSVRDFVSTVGHELIHYIQQLRGDIAKSGYSGEKITEDDKLIKLEEEAYLKSGLYLRKYREKLGAYDK